MWKPRPIQLNFKKQDDLGEERLVSREGVKEGVREDAKGRKGWRREAIREIGWHRRGLERRSGRKSGTSSAIHLHFGGWLGGGQVRRRGSE